MSFETRIDAAHQAILDQKSDRAMDELIAAVVDLNQEIGLPSSDLGDKLTKAINRLRQVAREVAKEAGAASYTIGAGVPGGITISVSFTLK